MKKFILPLLGLATLPAFGQSKLDAASEMIMDQYRILQSNPSAKVIQPANSPVQIATLSRSGATASVIITLAEGVTASDIEAQGFEVLYSNQTICVANGSMDDIASLAQTDLVKGVSFGRRMSPYLDKAREATGVQAILDGTVEDIDQPYTGKGVLAGLYDQGVDPCHINFAIGSTGEGTRIAYAMKFLRQDGTIDKEIEEPTPEQLMQFGTDTSSDFHGTHVMGCLTGSYNGRGGKVATYNRNDKPQVLTSTNNPYYGAAPEATIAFGAGELFEPNYIVALGKIIDYAKKKGMPLVFNMSLGSIIGSHDGTDGFGQFAKEAGKDAIICISAGNDGDMPMSIDATGSFKTFINMSASGADGQLCIWAGTESFDFSIFVYDLSNNEILYQYDIPANSTEKTHYITGSVYTGEQYIKPAAFGRAFDDNSYVMMNNRLKNNANGRASISCDFKLTPNSSTNKNRNLVIGISASSSNPSQRILATDGDHNGFTSHGVSGFTNGSSVFTINDLACSPNVISVGSFNTRQRWPVISKNSFSYPGAENEVGKISPFSSYGTLMDGQNKPTVCGPGQGIVSSISTYFVAKNYNEGNILACSAERNFNSRDNYWQCEQGTSMSSPFVAGIIALWLEADPTLKYEDVLKIITETSVKDEFTETSGTPVQWGAGKIDAVAGLRKVLNLGGVSDVAVDKASIMSKAVNGGYEVFVPGAKVVQLKLHNISGAEVASATANTDTATISTIGLAKGIYILTANGNYSRKIVVK